MKRHLLLICCAIMAVASMAQQKAITHVVEQGETLTSIATKYGIPLNALLQANGDIGSALFPGLLLTIPQNANTQIKDTDVAQEQKSDILQMKDGSYILCMIADIRPSMVLIEQGKQEGIFSIPVREIDYIQYMNGKREYFNK
ncbi:MAG: LysM peptidoglycan-binding domain-containing protein [Prevotella sp.]|nr:LysM peptidoglycan-binding domain-containing protein [Prevotella sp.]